jgi:hypothetical protein
MHGQSREVLERDGHSVWCVANALNKSLSAAVAVFTDAPVSDANWLSVLFEDFPQTCSFGLHAFSSLLNMEISGIESGRALTLLREAQAAADRKHLVRHRALPDVLRLRDTWLHVARAVRVGDRPEPTSGQSTDGGFHQP